MVYSKFAPDVDPFEVWSLGFQTVAPGLEGRFMVLANSHVPLSPGSEGWRKGCDFGLDSDRGV